MYTLRRRRMDKEKFNRAIELNKKIEEYFENLSLQNRTVEYPFVVQAKGNRQQ